MSDTSQGGDTGSGFLQGVDPAQPRLAADWGGQQTPAQQVTQPPVTFNERPPDGPRTFTEEDLTKARTQEKDKLYGRIEEMDAQLKEFQKERREADKLKKAEEQRLADEERRKQEEQMELRDLLQRKDEEWKQRFSTIEAERERDRATFEREKAMLEVESYRRDRIEQEAEFILPELRDLIRGNSPTDIDAAIEDMKYRTNAVLNNFSAVSSQQPTPRGASPTSPPVGPMEQQTTYEQLTPDDIRSMDIETYKRYRDTLLASASRQHRGGR